MIASGVDRHFDITFGLHLVDSSSLVSVLFREAFSHLYISFFHLLENVFSVTEVCLRSLCVRDNCSNPLLQFGRFLDENDRCIAPVVLISFSKLLGALNQKLTVLPCVKYWLLECLWLWKARQINAQEPLPHGNAELRTTLPNCFPFSLPILLS